MDDFANLRGMVNNTLAHFDNSQISSALRVPGQIDGKRLEDIDKLSIDEISNIFENGVDAKVGRRWSIETAKDPWKEWLSYVNKQFTFEQHPLELSAEALHMAIAAWRGERVDWARLLDKHMRRLLWEKPGTLPENHELQCYLSALCRAYQQSGSSQPRATHTATPKQPRRQASGPKRQRILEVNEPVADVEMMQGEEEAPSTLAPAFNAEGVEELEARVAIEASRATEAEDRLQDLTVHTEQQAALIEEQVLELTKLRKACNDHLLVRTAMSNAARLKDEMLTTA